MKNITNSGHYRFSVGALQVLVVTDGESLIGNIQPMFAPNVEPELLRALLERNFLATESITLAGNVLVVLNSDRIILIDTGCGPLLSPTAGKLLENLSNAGIKAEEVTDVVLTHAHPDHIGGLIDETGNPVFKNAEIYISKIERDFWMAEKPDFSKGTHDGVADFEIGFAKTAITAVDDKLKFFNDGEELFDCLSLAIAPGHTPGHTVITVSSQDEELVHIADAFQHILLLEHPEWGNQIDSDFNLGIQTRRKISE